MFVSNQEDVLQKIKKELNIEPMKEPYEYVKNIQTNFDDSKIQYTEEYYEILGLESPYDKKEENHKNGKFEVVEFLFKKKK